MLITFSVKNFLSFNEKQTLSLEAGKTRKFSKRIYKDKHIKLTKCVAIFGGNASGKSNLIEAFKFVQEMLIDGLPVGFSNKYFRQIPSNQDEPSSFEIELLLDGIHIVYGFSMNLKSGCVLNEYLYELTVSGNKRTIFSRNLDNLEFLVGEYFKNSTGIDKIRMYGEDSISDSEMLFLSIINQGKSKMYEENQELLILRKVYLWFRSSLDISSPNDFLSGYPYFTQSNLNEIAEILNALGTGIHNLRIVTVPLDVIKTKIPENLFSKVLTDLERKKAKKATSPTIMLRSYKEFYTFELNDDNNLVVKTIEFSHEKDMIYFSLKEESDGTARLLDLIELLLKVSDNRTFIIDEMDRCLHPIMTTRILEQFLKMAEMRNSQLIITTHESRLLASEFLRNDEICFVVKNKNGESILNPLEKYQLRADKKVYAALFDGTLDDVLPSYNLAKMETILSKTQK